MVNTSFIKKYTHELIGDANSRISLAKSIISKTNFKTMKIIVKEFYSGENIFTESSKILDKKILGNYEYYIDGLIYTPKSLPVPSGGTWNNVFKWKPPEDNTIDFLVRMGDNFTTKDSIKYRVLDLFVGYNPVQWEMISPLMFLENKLNRIPTYIAKEFKPADVTDPNFTKCFMRIQNEKDEICCLNGDKITNESIVEFKYTGEEWQPLRVRQDKTEMLSKTKNLSGTANDYSTAINIWRSITYPVNEDMIRGKKLLTSADIVDDGVYYYRSTTRDKFASKPMLDFHNYWIKNRMLIGKFADKESLFDISCGQGGDLPKWIEHNFVKVLGVDISRDNIENPVNGVYARLLENTKYQPSRHKYVFVTLDSSKYFTRDYFESLTNENDKKLTMHLWGHTQIENSARLKPYFEFTKSKFNVVSCQFSIHYFFENEKKLDDFIWNVNEHLAEHGYFIGTCLDGFKVKQKLNRKKQIQGEKNNKIMWHIRKKYKGDKTITYGEVIEVYMESIGKIIKEYVVNFDLLISKLAKYNIELVTRESFEESFKGIPSSETGPIINSIKNMTDIDKEYSFMNMWFIFVKKPAPIKKKLMKKKL
jgi:hypothetical protein